MNAQLAYDPVRGVTVLFGGIAIGDPNACSPAALGSTWTWDGIAWTLQPLATSPSARHYAAFGWDPATARLVLYGGCNTSVVSRDTWTWAGAWQVLDPDGGKSTPYDEKGALAFAEDGGGYWIYRVQNATPATKRWDGGFHLTPFAFPADAGGYHALAGINHSRRDSRYWAVGPRATPDTEPFVYRLDEAQGRWESMGAMGLTSPMGSFAFAGRADGVLYIFGGELLPSGAQTCNLWEYDPSANTWTRRGPAGGCTGTDWPIARLNASLSWDSARGVLVLYGGRSSGSPLSDTWELTDAGAVRR